MKLEFKAHGTCFLLFPLLSRDSQVINLFPIIAFTQDGSFDLGVASKHGQLHCIALKWFRTPLKSILSRLLWVPVNVEKTCHLANRVKALFMLLNQMQTFFGQNMFCLNFPISSTQVLRHFTV